MGSEMIRMTTSEAIVRYLIAQRTVIDEQEVPLFPGVLAIFGHGNVTSFGTALEGHRDEIPVWRGQNEQGMGLAAAGFAKAMRRRQIMVCSSSLGPGATNFITAAGVAMSNRLPVLFISGDTFHSRLQDPVLQQVEHFGAPSTTVNDGFRPVVRYWDRITHPAQVLSSLPQMLGTLLDPADCGPAFLGLPQDVAAESYDYPAEFFSTHVHRITRPRPDSGQIELAAAAIRTAARPVIISGGGVHYSLAEPELAVFASAFGIPVVETVAGKSALLPDHPSYAGPVGVAGAEATNDMVRDADLVIAVGTRLEDFTTGSWTAFSSDAKFVALNAARFDALKHRAIPVIGDARESLLGLQEALQGWTAELAWTARAAQARAGLEAFVAGRSAPDGHWPPSYAQLIAEVHDGATAEDYILTAAGGLPGEINVNWGSKGIATVDTEYGFSCMGYEIAGAWGAAFARTSGQVYAMVGDGSYLMMNSDIYSSVLSGKKFVLVVCDNEGYAVIERLQVGQGGASYNNMLRDARGTGSSARVDFHTHAQAMGALTFTVSDMDELRGALAEARVADRTTVIVTKVRASDWTLGGAFWEVGVPTTSDRAEVNAARAAMDEGLARQRRGV